MTKKTNRKGWAGKIPVYCAFDKIVELAELKPNPKNPNRHPENQIELLAKIIETQGWRAPVKVSTRSGYIVSGHGRFLAAQMIGCPVPVDFQDYATEADEMSDLLADNRIAELAEMDNAMLAEIFSEIDGDLGLTGYTDSEVQDLMNILQDSLNTEVIDDAPPEVSEEMPITMMDDIWEIGGHRLLCGDSTDEKAVGILMDGQEADMLLTDPPYNVAYEGKGKDGEIMTIQNDNMEDAAFRKFLVAAFENAVYSLKPGGAFHIWHADSEGYNFRSACREAGMRVRQCLIWVKNSMVMGRQDYQWKHEPCLYGWKDGAAHYFVDDRTQTTVIEDKGIDLKKLKKEEMLALLQEIYSDKISTTVIHEDKPLRNDEHPTMKPIKLLARQVRNSSRPGELVLDLFGGSGSTLITCEQLGRICYTMELDERYCDVIVKRYLKFTGKDDVVLIRGGKRIPLGETGILAA